VNRSVAGQVRVCVVAPSLGILGGQAVQAQRLVEHLERDSSVSAELLPVNPRLPGVLGQLQRIKYVRTVLTSVRYFASLLTRIRHYDVIHVFSASYWSYLLAPLPAMLVGRLYGKKVILNYHSGEAADHFTRSHLAVRSTRLAHEVVVPSEYLVEVLRHFGIQARAIFNFVDLENIPYRRRTSLQPRFLSNRNLEPMYNVACVLRAFARVQREVPGAELVVAGFGSQREPLERFAKELGLRNTSFVGRISPEAMAEHYDRADLFLNGSDIDNMPLSIMDSFAAGVPVVSTNAGGIPYLVRDGETGLLVERGDDEALAAGALRLLRDDELASRVADAAREQCVTRFTWDAVRGQWEEVYTGEVMPTLKTSPLPLSASL
jgi:glycosyltransferase involved in cell wall biosynthesis